MLALSTAPGIAVAQTVIGMAYIPAATDLPPAMRTVVPDYRATAQLGYLATPRAQPAAMLAHLFALPDGLGAGNHRHAAAFAIGGVELVAEAMRERMLIATGGIGRGARVLDRVAAAGFTAGWAVGARDTLSLGVAADRSKRTEPAILVDHKSIDSSAAVADCTWAHGSHLQMSLAWRADRSSTEGGLNRVVELAQGAALRETGFRMTLSYLLAGAAASRSTTVGIAARDARIAADDLATLGSVNRQDIQTALFLRTAL
jgi:hypothetical protein